MKRQTIFGLASLALVISLLPGCAKAGAQESSEANRTIELTVYKQDFALVHESRSVELNQGRTSVRLDNVSKSIDPNTVLFDWPGGTGPEIVSQRVDLGVASGASLLKRLEGKKVEMLWNSQDGQPHDRIEGTLESSHDGGFILRSGGKLYVNPPGTIVAPGDSGLAAGPQLSTEIDSPKKTESKLGFAYQTRGMSWSADYAGRLSADGNSLDLECWATVENHTGLDYPEAKITLVAGSPNRAVVRLRGSAAAGLYDDEAVAKEKMPMASPMVMPESVGELYAYPVPAPATIGQEQINRVKILHVARVPIRNDYSVRLGTASAYAYYDRESPHHQNAQLAITFVNDAASGLGMPLPSGAVRLYTGDSPIYIGASEIGDMAKGQKVNLTISNVFDVTVDSRMTKTQRVDKHTTRRSFEAVIHNAKKTAVQVRVVQDFYGRPKIVTESAKGQMLDSGTRQWRIPVAAGADATLTWTADFRT